MRKQVTEKAFNLFISIFFLFLFTSVLSQSSQSQIHQIHSLLDSSNYYSGLDDLKSLKFARKANIIALKLDDSKEIAQTSLFIARGLHDLEMYKESLKYINIGIPLAMENKNILMAAQLKELKLYNYDRLGFSDQAFQLHKEIIDLLSDEKDYEAKQLISRLYGYIGINYFQEKKDYKTADIYIDKALKTFPKDSGEEYDRIDRLYIIKGYNLLYQKKYDSAYYYFIKNYSEKTIQELCSYQQLTALGDYYYELKKYSEALTFFQKTLNLMNECNLVDAEYSIEINEKISKIYGFEGDKVLEEKYLQEYYKESLALKDKNKENIPTAVNMILRDQEEKHASKNTRIIIIISVICLIIIVFSYWKYYLLRKKKKKIIKEKEHYNEYLTKRNEHLTREVEEKKFLELIDLAKSNHPEFLVLFEELYPNLIFKLKELNPKIRNSELAFCALAYLNFSTKDIAQYTFVAIATVHSRKNRFRKKYNIPSDDDFNVWMREFGDTN